MPPEGSRRRWRAVAFLALLGLAAVAGFLYVSRLQGSGGPVEGTQLTREELKGAYSELCRVRLLSETDVEQATDLFYGRVHSPLHDIARGAGEVDRAAAARLLEAKNDVERALNQSAPGPDTTAALDRLLPRTAQALRSVGVTPSACSASRAT